MARGPLGMDEILESVGMVGRDHLDIRTVTLGINLRGCRTPEDVVRAYHRHGRRPHRHHRGHRGRDRHPHRQPAHRGDAHRLGRRPSATSELLLDLARALDEAATRSASTSSAASAPWSRRTPRASTRRSWPRCPCALAETERVCGSVNVATTGCRHQHGRGRTSWARSSRRPPTRTADRVSHRLRQARRLRQRRARQPLHGRCLPRLRRG